MANGPLQAMAWSQDDKSELDVGKLAVVKRRERSVYGHR
jgi:hypothetical protein